MSHTDLRDTPSNLVPPTIQESNRVSENNSPDTIEMLYIESPSIGLVEFRKRIEALITQQVTAATVEELGHIQANYGPYVAQTMAGGEWQTIKERMNDLSALTNNNKGEKE